MFGIIDDDKKFILIDENRDVLRATALILLKQTEDGLVPMFDENSVDEAIKEYSENDIETAYDNDKYLKGFTPKPKNDYQSMKREKAYVAEVDPITAHIIRLRDMEQTKEVVEKINELVAERDIKVAKIKEKIPYAE